MMLIEALLDFIFILCDALLNLYGVLYIMLEVKNGELDFGVLMSIVIILTITYAIIHFVVKYKWQKYMRKISAGDNNEKA